MAQTRDGGKPNVKSLPYATPQGPKGQMHQGAGLGDYNYGNKQGAECYRSSGSPGIGGKNSGNKGSQDDPQY